MLTVCDGVQIVLHTLPFPGHVTPVGDPPLVDDPLTLGHVTLMSDPTLG